MERKTSIRIDTQNNYLFESLKKVIESRCQGLFPFEFISREDEFNTPSVIIMHEVRTIKPKEYFPNSYGQPVVVQLRGKGGAHSIVLHSCTLDGLCIFQDDTVDTVSSVMNHALQIHSLRLAPHQHCFRCKLAHLTQVEHQFLFHFLGGKSPKEISVLTGRNIKIVSSQKRSVMKKLNLKTDWELFHYFYDNRKK